MNKIHTPFRLACLPVLAVLASVPAYARSDATQAAPNPGDQAQAARTQAQWADLEAQIRVADGDYDGAVQAHQQAEKDWQQAQRQRR